MLNETELFKLEPSHRLSLVKGGLLYDDSLEIQTNKLFEVLKDDPFFLHIKQNIWEQYHFEKPIANGPDHLIGSLLNSMLEKCGLSEMIKGIAINEYERNSALNTMRSPFFPFNINSRKSEDELVDCIRNARISWELGINEELIAIMMEQKREFVMMRGPKETNPIFLENPVVQPSAATTPSLLPGTTTITATSAVDEPEPIKFLFDSEDLLETGAAIRNANMKPLYCDRYMGMIKLSLKTYSLDDFIKKYNEMNCSVSHLGIDEGLPQGGTKLLISRHEEAEALLAKISSFRQKSSSIPSSSALQSSQANGNLLSVRKYMRRGVPPALRHRIWRVALGLQELPTPTEQDQFSKLRKNCDRFDLITDELFLHDIQAVTDDPRFFVFEEELKEVVLSFSRDEWIQSNCYYQIHAPIPNKMGSEFGSTVTAPPCGVQPFLGFATYFAPLGYICKSRASYYSLSRMFFCKVWCKLNVLSSDRDTLLPVCKIFECLLIQINPKLFLHLINIGVQPLKIAFPWIQLGFVGLLEIDQLLHLWDRLLGYMDPNILAVAAVAVFIHRGEALLKSSTEVEVSAILMEGSRIQIITLIQMLLIKDNRIGS